jgi:hypothetical protein
MGATSYPPPRARQYRSGRRDRSHRISAEKDKCLSVALVFLFDANLTPIKMYNP